MNPRPLILPPSFKDEVKEEIYKQALETHWGPIPKVGYNGLTQAEIDHFSFTRIKVLDQAWQDYQTVFKMLHHLEDNIVLINPGIDLDYSAYIKKHLEAFESKPNALVVKYRGPSGEMQDLSSPIKFLLEASLLMPDRSKIDKSVRLLLENFTQAQNRGKYDASINLPFWYSFDNLHLPYGTPLSVAISNTWVNMANTLVDLGAKVGKHAAYFGNTPLILSVSKGWNHVSDLPSFLRGGQVHGQQQIIERLLLCVKQEGAEFINAQDFTAGRSALHYACLRGDDPVLIQKLIEAGADIHLKDFEGKTPLDLLAITYEEAQTIIEKASGSPSAFGAQAAAENRCFTATLPTRVEFGDNKLKIKNILSNTADEKDDSSSSLTPKT